MQKVGMASPAIPVKRYHSPDTRLSQRGPPEDWLTRKSVFLHGSRHGNAEVLRTCGAEYLAVETLRQGFTGVNKDVNRKRKQGVVMPLSCESRQAPDTGHTGRDSCPSPGEGVAPGGRGSRVQPQEDESPPDGAAAVRTFL
ncbi:hypothetical protein EYF80_023090 [Liparis tanakae]|uniref:Uncharacterized protein n=1 Tax=Liparis tanakae TaxID=230148 RepID=A0A4Z2HMD4_9TELE|nr:hypothetical protein EYF80_023090 [Liparis tanakae]